MGNTVTSFTSFVKARSYICKPASALVPGWYWTKEFHFNIDRDSVFHCLFFFFINRHMSDFVSFKSTFSVLRFWIRGERKEEKKRKENAQ